MLYLFLCGQYGAGVAGEADLSRAYPHASASRGVDHKPHRTVSAQGLLRAREAFEKHSVQEYLPINGKFAIILGFAQS
jgi:hypothetical protein